MVPQQPGCCSRDLLTWAEQVNGSEDCLYLGLYGRPWRKGQALRPVVVAFYGGGFVQGSAAFTMPPPAYPILNVSAASDMIFVYPNYRVNAFGFLSGREVAQDADSDANVGLLDQQMALQVGVPCVFCLPVAMALQGISCTY